MGICLDSVEGDGITMPTRKFTQTKWKAFSKEMKKYPMSEFHNMLPPPPEVYGKTIRSIMCHKHVGQYVVSMCWGSEDKAIFRFRHEHVFEAGQAIKFFRKLHGIPQKDVHYEKLKGKGYATKWVKAKSLEDTE